MSEQSYPVMVVVKRPDGSTEQVRVGTAVRQGDNFILRLGELTVGAFADLTPPARAGAAEGMVFPPYGRSKGMPIAGATMQDLEFYANGSRRSLADPAKARWHDKERALLAAIEAEMARQRGGGGGGDGGGGDDYDGPPDDGPPPRSDEDIPF